MRRNLVNEIMAESIIYGGCVATRREVYYDLIDSGCSTRFADLYAFLPPALQEGDPCPSLTLAMVREWEAQREIAT